jgi:hypothetical protein
LRHDDLKSVPAGEASNMEVTYVPFGFKDTRHREVGYLVTTYEVDMVPTSPDDPRGRSIESGHYYLLNTQYAANRAAYGTKNYDCKFFPSASLSEISLRQTIDLAKSRAFDKSREGARLKGERLSKKISPSDNKRSKQEKLAAKRVDRERLATEQIPIVEAQVQTFLDDTALMEYLASNPWPYVMNNTPSMAYTAHDAIVKHCLGDIAHTQRPGYGSDAKVNELAYLKSFLKLLQEQSKRFRKGMPFASPLCNR